MASATKYGLPSRASRGSITSPRESGATVGTRGSRRSFGSPSSSSAAMAATTTAAAPRQPSNRSHPNLATNNRKPSAIGPDGVRFIASYDDSDDDADGHESRQMTSLTQDGVKGSNNGLLSVITIPTVDGQQQPLEPPKSPAKKVRSIFAQSGAVAPLMGTRPLFTQMDVLVHFEDCKPGWKEMARWLKYEETVEIGDRWSKPHVPTTSLSAIMKLREAIAEGQCAVGFDVNTKTDDGYPVAGAIIETMRTGRNVGVYNAVICQSIKEVLLRPHKHKHRTTMSSLTTSNHKVRFTRHGRHRTPSDDGEHNTPTPTNRMSSVSSDEDEDDGGLAASHGAAHRTKKPLLRRRTGVGKDIASVYHNYPPGVKPDNLAPFKPNKSLMKKLPASCEAANLLIGQCDFLAETIMTLCRLGEASIQSDLTEVLVPTRFAFVLLGPPKNTSIWEFTEIGRAVAALFNDRVFCEVAYHAKNPADLVDGIDEFLDHLTVLPPSIWDRSVRLEPPDTSISMDKIRRRLSESKRGFTGPECPPQEEGASDDTSLMRTGRFFGGLIKDVRNRYRFFLSDFKDALHVQCVASTIFLFFACITPIVTFGGLMGQKTDGNMGTMETLMAGAICGVFYALFAGQPLTIIGATGPLLIFESILYHLCKENHLEFMSFRFWIGAWVMVALLLIVAFDLSALVRYITRFTEESFAILISVIFIVEAFTKIFEIWDKSPVHFGVVREPSNFVCLCSPSNQTDFASNSTGDNSLNQYWNETSFNGSSSETNNWLERLREDCITHLGRVVVSHDCATRDQCIDNDWTLEGAACDVKSVTTGEADVFLLSFILFIGTFAVAMFFRTVRTGRYFPSIMKSTLADFAVLLAVVICTGVDIGFGLNTPKLNVPSEFKPTNKDRGWIINPGAVTHIWLIPLAAIPAILGTILIFLDQQITAVIINRKEHKLLKGHGYHLDLLVVAILIGICSLLGLPWFVAATVRSVTHVRSLFRQSDVRAPGEKPQMLGVREQRLTGICIHLLIGFSTLLTVVLQLIPMPVLYGVFLYMGVTSLGGVQFVQRVCILLMPVKYQPDYIFLRHVRAIRVHCFTAIQIVCFVLMWVVKSVKVTSIAFPIMLIFLMVVRKLLDYLFTQSDLYWLDHLLPEEQRREKEDKQIDHHSLSEADDIITELVKHHENNNSNMLEAKRVPQERKMSRDFSLHEMPGLPRKMSQVSMGHRSSF